MFTVSELVPMVWAEGEFCTDEEVLERFLFHGKIEVWQRPDLWAVATRRIFQGTKFAPLFSILPFNSFFGY